MKSKKKQKKEKKQKNEYTNIRIRQEYLDDIFKMQTNRFGKITKQKALDFFLDEYITLNQFSMD